jgi:transcription initiation factor TFIIE subunit alpha
LVRKNISDFLIVQEFLKSTAGDYAVDLVRTCENKRKGVSDEFIGKKIPIKITEIRAILNRLHYRGIAEYSKTKDCKSGWYYYNWEIKKDRIIELIVERQMEEVEKLRKKQFLSENYDFFACRDFCADIPFEVAAEYNFKCPRCGGGMDIVDNIKRVRSINRRIRQLEKEMGGIAALSSNKTRFVGQFEKPTSPPKKGI